MVHKTRDRRARKREKEGGQAFFVGPSEGAKRSITMSRPELTAPAQYFYDAAEAKKYTTSSRVIEIQERLTERALELLNFPRDDRPRFLLDIGCGSGLSGDRLSELGQYWVGCDISRGMLNHAVEREVEGDVLELDIGHGVPFRPGVFDGCVSISAIQWLCNADKSEHDPRKRLKTFFSQTYRCLKRGAKCAFQFYPENARQAEMIASSALRVGFSGGLVVDYPNSTRAKKYFLVLAAGPPDALPTAKTDEANDYANMKQDVIGRGGKNKFKHNSDFGLGVKKKRKGDKHARTIYMGSKSHPEGKGKAWVIKKKQQMRNRGVKVANDSKYTGRKRKERF